MKNNKVIYTVITGDYDTVIEPTTITPGWDYICFTNNPNVQPKSWEVVRIDSDEPHVLLSRRPKICFFEYVRPEHNICVYIDANIMIQCNLDEYVAKALPDGMTIGTLLHPGWGCAYQEAEAIKRLGKANPEVVDRQVGQYASEGFPRNYGQVFANLIVYRNYNIKVREHCKHWWNEFSHPDKARRDQLSFHYINWKYRLINLHMTSSSVLHNNEFKILPHG